MMLDRFFVPYVPSTCTHLTISTFDINNKNNDILVDAITVTRFGKKYFKTKTNEEFLIYDSEYDCVKENIDFDKGGEIYEYNENGHIAFCRTPDYEHDHNNETTRGYIIEYRYDNHDSRLLSSIIIKSPTVYKEFKYSYI